MKFLKMDYEYYQFPQGIETIQDFIAYLNDKYNSFIPMVQYSTENCVFPYLIEEEKKTVYLNVSQIEEISEDEGAVLCRKDYEARLEKVIQQKCVNCAYYEEDNEEDNMEGHRDKLSLDGECWRFTKKKD